MSETAGQQAGTTRKEQSMSGANEIFKAEGEFFCRVKCAWQKNGRSGWTLEVLDEDMHELGVQFLAAPAGSRWLDELTSAVGRLWAGDYATQTAVLGGDMCAAVGLTGAVKIVKKNGFFNCHPICPATLEASLRAARQDAETSAPDCDSDLLGELVKAYEVRGVDDPDAKRAWVKLFEDLEYVRETAEPLPSCWREINGRQVRCATMTKHGLRYTSQPRGWLVERRGRVIARQDGWVIEVLDSKMPVPALD